MRHNVIFVIGILCVLICLSLLVKMTMDSRQSLTVDSARQLLRQGFDLRGQGKYEEAIKVLERVVRYDPRLEASFPNEGIELLQATWELAMTYYANNDWGKALPLFEQCDKDMRDKNPDADLLSPSMIIECRKKLGITGSLSRDPIIVAPNQNIIGECKSMNGILMVPAKLLAKQLHLDKTKSGSNSIRIYDPKIPSKQMILSVGSIKALSNGETLLLPTAPIIKGTEVLVPMKTVVEYFGYKVKWDPIPLVAWVF